MNRWLHVLALLAPLLGMTPSWSQDGLLVGKQAIWNYHAGNLAPPRNWTKLDFRGEGWPAGKAGFGYGDRDDATRLAMMRGNFSRLQIRSEFQISDLSQVRHLFLYISYDDGFIAYLNGKELTRRNVAMQHRGTAAGNHEIEGFEEIVIPAPSDVLRQGRNVLAVEGFNRSIDSSDFSLQPVLSAVPQKDLVGTSDLHFPSGKSVVVHHAPNATVRPKTLSRDQATADLQELQRRVEDQSSYVHRNRFDREQEFRNLIDSLPEEISLFELAEKMERLIAKIGDGHARVDVGLRDPRASFLPFTLADSSKGVVALKSDRSGLIEPDFPRLIAIDGIPLNRWMGTAAFFVADGSPQLIRHRSLSVLRRVDLIRRCLNLQESMRVEVTLQSLDGNSVVERQLNLIATPSPTGRVPIARTKLLDDQIGYLRLGKMDNSLESFVNDQMKRFRASKGLIIDVRDNGGGRYGLLRLMHGYLTPPDSSPYVTNIAAYRKSPSFQEDHLHYRPTFREDHEGWDARHRQAIRVARQDFQPEWKPPKKLFSRWHYMVVDKTQGVGQYHYDRPVVVLCNSGSFSATDGFLSCMASIPNVILLGEPSGGGSGATRRFSLPESGIRIALSSMASFRPNGKLFDGNGVEVDIEMKPTISDYLGRSDTVRSRAVELILASPQ